MESQPRSWRVDLRVALDPFAVRMSWRKMLSCLLPNVRILV